MPGCFQTFEIVHYEGTLYSGKALTIFCEKTKKPSALTVNYANDKNKIKRYKESWLPFNKYLKEFLDSLKDPIAVFGCGARSCNFVNFTGIKNSIHSFIDDQIEKQNQYVPGNLLKVNKWNEEMYKDFIFLLGVNTENEFRVIQEKRIELEKIYSILPPSRNLPKFWTRLILNQK